MKQLVSQMNNKKISHRCRRRASNDSSHNCTSSREGIRLFSDKVASVVRRRIKFAARDLKSFALEENPLNQRSIQLTLTYIVAAFDFFFFVMSDVEEEDVHVAVPRVFESSSSLTYEVSS